MTHSIVVGAGVVGLSIAWELVKRGHRVTVVERGRIGRQASWAGAGILLPANEQTAVHPLEQLTALSNRLHAEWSAELRSETGIDNGYQVCGGVYLARSAGEQAALAGLQSFWDECQIKYCPMSSKELAKRYNFIETSQIRAAMSVPEEAQIRNPLHLLALESACQLRGVDLVSHAEEVVFETQGNELVAIRLGERRITADVFCVAAGAWSSQVLTPLGIQLPMIPVRGQMLLYQSSRFLLKTILNEGSRYIVPRQDGHLLVGSTTEEAGFQNLTTAEGIRELKEFAERLIPKLTSERLLNSWAGLRPATYDGFPYLGKMPNWENGFVATGHFKVGLQQSTGTAVLMAELIETQTPTVEMAVFAPSRVPEFGV